MQNIKLMSRQKVCCAMHILYCTHPFYCISIADIDECSLEGTCVPEAVCTNSFGSFSCMCRTGFTGNETYCEGKVIEIEVAVQILAWRLNIPCETLVCQSCSLIHKEALVYTAIVAWWTWFTGIISPHSVL